MNNPVFLPHGFIKELALKFKCNRATVREALRTNKPGRKKEAIRSYVHRKYNYELNLVMNDELNLVMSDE